MDASAAGTRAFIQSTDMYLILNLELFVNRVGSGVGLLVLTKLSIVERHSTIIFHFSSQQRFE